MGIPLEGAALPASARHAVRCALVLLATLVAVIAATCLPQLRGRLPAPLTSEVLHGTAIALAAALVLARAALVSRDRRAWAAFGLAIVASGLADLYYVTQVRGLHPGPAASASDVGYLVFYPLAYVGVALLLQARIVRWHTSTWLDGLVAGCGLAALAAAIVLDPLLPGWSSHASLAMALAYPVGDVLILSLLVGGLAIVGRHAGTAWWLLTVGLAAFVVGDVAYLTVSASDASYAGGGWIDLSWTVGFALVAVASWSRAAEPSARPVADWALLAVPLAFACTSVVLLMTTTGRHGEAEPWVVALSGAAVMLALARTALTLREVRALAEAREQARTDDLTGLPNRRALLEHLDAVGPRYALLLLDIDSFREVNDSFGHPVGDELLRLMGPRLDEALSGSAMLTRMGGDEFGIVLRGADRAAAGRAALEVKVALREAFELDGMSVHIDASIGIALAPEHGTSPTALLRGADIAMYDAKSGASGYTVYTPGEASSARRRLQTLEELRDALSSGQLVVHFQPKLALATGRVVGVEALVRWEHPVRGLLYPDAFLPLAEQAGLMRQVAERVLERSLAAVRSWRADGHDLHVAVNLSASDLRDSALPAQVLALVARFGLPTDALVLEITEGMLMMDSARSRDVLTQLQAVGVRVAVDDFGTGYSSLAYLRELPVHELKLDRSFVSHLRTDSRAAAIVRSTVQLSHELGMVMVAEGVEDAYVQDQLAEWGCDVGQGYHIARPMGAGQIGPWLRARSGATAGGAADADITTDA